MEGYNLPNYLLAQLRYLYFVIPSAHSNNHSMTPLSPHRAISPLLRKILPRTTYHADHPRSRPNHLRTAAPVRPRRRNSKTWTLDAVADSSTASNPRMKPRHGRDHGVQGIDPVAPRLPILLLQAPCPGASSP